MKINQKRIISFLLAFILSFAIVAPLNTSYAAEEDVIQILHLNDVHGRVSESERDSEIGYAKLKTRIDQLRVENPNTLLLNAGDTVHGTTTVNITQGETMIDLMNIMGFDAMVPGNHDFNFGYKQLLKLKGLADFPLLATNIKKEADDSTDFNSYKIFTMENGLKVGVFGLGTDETKFKSHPDNTIGIKFTDVVVESKKAVKQLQAENVDVIVALAHLGVSSDTISTSTKVAENVPQIDVIIDGHSHTKLLEGKMVNGVLIAQAEAQTKNLGVVNITLEDKIVKTKVAKLEGYESFKDVAKDQEIVDAIEAIDDENAPILNEIIGKTNIKLDGERGNVRTGETNLGNLITDAMRTVTSSDIALTNGGGIRASIAEGDITFRDVVTSFPFTNILAVIEVTGTEVKQALEHGVDAYPEEAGHFAHVSGIRYKFNPENPVGERIVEITTMDGKPFAMDKTYRLVTNDFMASGGDNYTMFAGKEIIAEGALLSDALLEYIRAEGEINITEEDRIVIGKEVEPVESKVERLTGLTRVGTAIEASKKSYDKAETVVLAGYNGEVDALTGTLLASANDAPLLITKKDQVVENLSNELTRLNAKTIYILGGEQVVSAEVEAELKKEGYTVNRIAGSNREMTAVAIAKEIKDSKANHVFLAKGYEELADALAIGPVSAMKHNPILLTKMDMIPKTTIDALKDMGVKKVTIVGGRLAVSKKVEQQLKDMKISVDRVSGDTREDTALEIANRYFDNSDTAIVTYGWNHADSLVGGYMGAKLNAPILLTNTNFIGSNTLDYLNTGINKAYVLGGSTVVSESVFNKVVNVLN